MEFQPDRQRVTTHKSHPGEENLLEAKVKCHSTGLHRPFEALVLPYFATGFCYLLTTSAASLTAGFQRTDSSTCPGFQRIAQSSVESNLELVQPAACSTQHVKAAVGGLEPE